MKKKSLDGKHFKLWEGLLEYSRIDWKMFKEKLEKIVHEQVGDILEESQ